MGPGKKGLKRALYRGGGRSVAEAAADRHHRPLSLALAGRDDAARGDARRLPAAEAKGKIRWCGASNLQRGAARRRARGAARRTACRATRSSQPEYNLYDRSGFDGALRDLCVAEEIGVITYYSLAKGFLSGKYRTPADLGQSPRGGGVHGYLNPRGLAHSSTRSPPSRRGTAPSRPKSRSPG